ncbi:hydratase [Loktanella salsilacus]|uniref:hydratase n=1 Tax=Loktanella salsilacus TaxID=195913 RepID=UPI00373664BD
MSDTDQIALALIAAHNGGARFAPDGAILTRAQILAIQSRVSAALGPVRGFKVGQAADGGAPVLAPIPSRYAVANGGTRTVADQLGIELEIGFTLTRPLPAGGLPPRPQDYFAPCAALELVDTRLTGPAAARDDAKFADLQINAGIVIGPALPGWDGSDFDTLTARLATPVQVVLDGQARVPGGSALGNLALLLQHLGDHCGGLQVGQTVITGSLCGLPWFTADTAVTGAISGFEQVSIHLIAP